MKRKAEISPLTFLNAAERMFRSKELDGAYDIERKGSRFSCDNIRFAIEEETGREAVSSPETRFYASLFKPEVVCDLAWWPRLENRQWDFESRILALLLAAEVLRERKNPARYQKQKAS